MLHFGKGFQCRRLTVGTLSASHGPDRGKPLVVALVQGDLVTTRVLGSRRTETVSVFDIHAWAIRRRVNAAQLDEARAKKARKAARRATARLDRDVRKLTLTSHLSPQLKLH